jgi:hypothetical protein
MEMSFPDMSYLKQVSTRGTGDWLLAGWAREKAFTVAPIGKPERKQLEITLNPSREISSLFPDSGVVKRNKSSAWSAGQESFPSTTQARKEVNY